MMLSSTLSPKEVLNSRPGLRDLSFRLVNDLFTSTWLASHIRMVELLPDGKYGISLLLSHVLSRSPGGFFYLMDEWLPNVSFVASDYKELSALVEQAIYDMEEEEGSYVNNVLLYALKSFYTQKPEFIYKIEAKILSSAPTSPYEHGPTEQMFWLYSDSFYFLEVHHES